MKPLGIFSGLIKRLPSATTLETQASTTAAASLNVPHGTAPTSPADGDVWTTSAGIYVRINGSTVGPLSASGGGGGSTPSGTSFPGSPATNDRFIRTDRGIEYYYDGTRWLSAQIFVLPIATQDVVNPLTTTISLRANNPWWNVYSIYVLTFSADCANTNTTAANYATVQLKTSDGAANTNLGASFSTQNDTISQHVGHSVTINSVVSSTVEGIDILVTETGAMNLYFVASISYRLVG